MYRTFTSIIWATLILIGTPLFAADQIQTAIFVMRLDGTGVRKVGQGKDFREHGSPRWSHDGKWLAFDAYNSPSGDRKFFVINVDGSGLIEVGENAMPDWSPDDKQLAYHHYGAGGVKAGVWVTNLDGQGRTWLAAGASPRWSPDGSKIALAGADLEVLDLVSGERATLRQEPFRIVNVGFSWAPDGKWLAFVGNRTGMSELFIISAEGSSQGLVSRATGDLSPIVGWSPDGKQVACSLGRRIHLVDAAGANPPRLIPNQTANNQSPSISPDGQWLAYSSDQTTADAK